MTAKKKTNLFTRGSGDYIIWIVTMLLLALGIIMVLSASAPASLSESGESYSYVKKQALAAGIGFVRIISGCYNRL
jgi:cell division protein FtsW (lipid II flippase)